MVTLLKETLKATADLMKAFPFLYPQYAGKLASFGSIIFAADCNIQVILYVRHNVPAGKLAKGIQCVDVGRGGKFYKELELLIAANI